MDKTVYVLGAGFSVSAGLPTQNELTKEIFNPQFADDKKYSLLQYSLFETQTKLLDLLKNEFGIDGNNEFSLSLEDIYTALDRCIQENSNFRYFHPEELLQVRQTLDAVLILALKSKSKLSKNSDYIKKFAKHLIESSLTRVAKFRKHDPISVITTNWDILLDLALREQLKINNNGVIDYMCYVSSLRDDPTIKPGIQALTEGQFIVKLLKIHGSINWLSCPKCQRIFIDFYRRVIDYGVFREATCKYCSKEYSSDFELSPRLRPMLLMPTFVKDLSNFQTKLIWRNSGIEISEANRIIFIGYSFPFADFEFRQILFRNIHRHTKIEVVLYDESNPDKVITSNYRGAINQESPEYRYLSFFGGKDLTIYFEGAESYINRVM